tara:strand:+ start:3341 stop:4486 length:1146 start_codon:yes stop_codon:yes gene_type:complete
MSSKDIQKDYLLELIDTFLKGNCTQEEILLLLNYYESFQDNNNWPSELGSEELLKARMLLRLEAGMKNDGKKRYHLQFRNYLKYAAVFLAFVGTAYFFVSKEKSSNLQEFIIPVNAITLTLESGETKVIDADYRMNITNANGEIVGVQAESTIVYKEDITTDKLVYNELSVPLGVRFQLVLSDGTEIQLNSGTTLKYPVKFGKEGNREVYLSGEAFFDVSKDKLHPFIVNSEEVKIEVLGTQFNVSSYPEDESVNTVLLEGSVKVSDAKNEFNTSVIVPGEKAALNKSIREMSIENVDVDPYVSWIQGDLNFKSIPFGVMLKKIERSYGVTIICNDEELKQAIFRARFNTEIESVEEVLNYISKIQSFTFERKGKIITINH